MNTLLGRIILKSPIQMHPKTRYTKIPISTKRDRPTPMAVKSELTMRSKPHNRTHMKVAHFKLSNRRHFGLNDIMVRFMKPLISIAISCPRFIHLAVPRNRLKKTNKLQHHTQLNCHLARALKASHRNLSTISWNSGEPELSDLSVLSVHFIESRLRQVPIRFQNWELTTDRITHKQEGQEHEPYKAQTAHGGNIEACSVESIASPDRCR
mmetsp:Transcript_174433/g.553660  ORF Transcript_174433/g.553660 Transcript_174433/m.553660 type:complete len:210 (+) Transcript_174433:1282-1911(+)